MNEILSQEEIDALISDKGMGFVNFTDDEIDALGEMGNISMGASATTLHNILRNKVTITTPRVQVLESRMIPDQFNLPFVAIKVDFTEGLEGVSLLLLKENDAKVIADLMMGGDGTHPGEEIDDIAISAVSEAMNQMVGSACTSLSAMLDKSINISAPEVFKIHSSKDFESIAFVEDNRFIVKISFRVVVGNLIDSEIMQLLPAGIAKQMVCSLLETGRYEKTQDTEINKSTQSTDTKDRLTNNTTTEADRPEAVKSVIKHDTVKVQPVALGQLKDETAIADSSNIRLIMDVPLEVTVELGRTTKQIKDVLQFGVGTIVELDNLAGEPVDILVNGKFIAKGEVVVIDENFGVRITDIVHPSKRIRTINK
jgi:flagellar motor switch protein FliN/FliY